MQAYEHQFEHSILSLASVLFLRFEDVYGTRRVVSGVVNVVSNNGACTEWWA
jgi:hypothetical protein